MDSTNVQGELAALDAEVDAFERDYEDKADGKAGIQKFGDATRALWGRVVDGEGHRDHQFRNIAETKDRLAQIKAEVQSGQLGGQEAQQALAQESQRFHGEADRVAQAQTGINASVGQAVHGAGRIAIVSAAGIAGTVAGGGVNIFAGAAAAVAAGSAYDALTVGAGAVDKKLGNGGNSAIAPTFDTQQSFGGLAAGALAGEKIEGKDLVHAGVGTALDLVSGFGAGQGIKATRAAVAATNGTVQAAQAAAGASVKTGLQQSAATLGVQSAGTAIDPSLSTRQKQQQIVQQGKDTLTQLPGQVVFGAASSAAGVAVQPANKLLDGAAQVALDGASNVGEASAGNVLAGQGAGLRPEQLATAAVLGTSGALHNVAQRGAPTEAVHDGTAAQQRHGLSAATPASKQDARRALSTQNVQMASLTSAQAPGSGATADAPRLKLRLLPVDHPDVPPRHALSYWRQDGETVSEISQADWQRMLIEPKSLHLDDQGRVQGVLEVARWTTDDGLSHYRSGSPKVAVGRNGAPYLEIDPDDPLQFYVDGRWQGPASVAEAEAWLAAQPSAATAGTEGRQGPAMRMRQWVESLVARARRSAADTLNETEELHGPATQARQWFDSREQARQHFVDLLRDYALATTSSEGFAGDLEVAAAMVERTLESGQDVYGLTLPFATRSIEGTGHVRNQDIDRAIDSANDASDERLAELLHTHPQAEGQTLFHRFGNDTLSGGDLTTFKAHTVFDGDVPLTVIAPQSGFAFTLSLTPDGRSNYALIQEAIFMEMRHRQLHTTRGILEVKPESFELTATQRDTQGNSKTTDVMTALSESSNAESRRLAQALKQIGMNDSPGNWLGNAWLRTLLDLETPSNRNSEP